MLAKPLVSAIIPTYNCASYISEAIESVLNQTYKNIEIIIVDDGSVDNTLEVMKKFIGKIRYYYQSNAGSPAARNTGLRAAWGEYFQFLDADDMLMPDKIELQVEAFQTLPRAYGIVYSDIRFFNYTYNAKLIERDLYHFSGDILNQLFWESPIPIPAATLIRKECIEKVGSFNEDLLHCDDYEFWLRASSLGYKFYYIDKVLALYRKRCDSLSANAIAQYRYTFMVFKNANNFIKNKRAKRDLCIARVFIWLDYILVKIGYFQQGIITCLVSDIVFLWRDPRALLNKLSGRVFRFFNNSYKTPLS